MLCLPSQVRPTLLQHGVPAAHLLMAGRHNTIGSQVERQARRIKGVLHQPHHLVGAVNEKGNGTSCEELGYHRLTTKPSAAGPCLDSATQESEHALLLAGQLASLCSVPTPLCSSPLPPHLQGQHVLAAVVANLEDAGLHLFVAAQLVRLLAAEGHQDGALGGALGEVWQGGIGGDL